MKILIKNAILIDPSTNLEKKLDLLIENGKIKNVHPKIKPTSDISVTINAENLVLSPGLIDIHVHLREPGNEEEETIFSGTRAAAYGGITSVFCMPNTNPPIDNQTSVEFVLLKAKNEGIINVFPVGAVTKNRQGEELTEIGELKKAGVVAISDDGSPVYNSKIMRRALEYSRMFDLVVMSHCEDILLTKGGCVNEGRISTWLGLRGIPKEAEEIMVIRDIILSSLTKSKLHITHVSTKNSIEFIRKAKEEGINVTCDVTPHHFVLTEDYFEEFPFNTNLKVNPPLRTKIDIEAIVEAIKDDTIDCISSDHAPHTVEEKNREFDLAPFGIIGLETLLPLCITYLHNKHKIPILKILKKLTNNPVKIFNIKNKGKIEIGYDADLVIFDPNEEFIVKSFVSKSSNSPFLGWKLKGKVKYTICGGKIVYKYQ